MKKFYLLLIAIITLNIANALNPTITSFSPASGTIGTLVTITGTNLNSPTVFTIGGASAIVVSNSGTTLVGMVMPGSVTGTVSVTILGGTATSSSNFIVTTTLSPTTQQGSKLIGTGAIGSPKQGYSVSISADGNTAIVGGVQDNSNIGAAWIYTRTAGIWNQQGNKLVGTGAIGSSKQGYSVSISADGNTAIVGGDGDNSGIGAAWVYTRTAGVWIQQGNKLVGTGAVYGSSGSQQGSTVSISEDGNTAIVGGVQDNSNVGAAWIYTRTAGVWTQQGNKLVGTGAVQGTMGSRQGSSVSISADGNTAIVGGNFDNSDIGAAWVYTRTAGIWTQQGNKLVGTGATEYPYQGSSVSISADGNTAIVGGYGDNSNIGAAWIYTRTAGVWAQQGNKLVGTGATVYSGQGSSVSISADGNTAIVGGDGDNSGIGATWVYTRTAGVWTQQENKLVGTGATGASMQGYSISISADGITAIIGGNYDNSQIGAAWVYTIQDNITTSANPVIGGITSGGGVFTYDTICTLKAISNTGYTFVNWTENGDTVSTDTIYTFNVTANRNLVANFTQMATQYTITTSANPINGGTASSGGTFTNNQTCTVKATPLTGYSFVDWTENGNIVSIDTSYTFTVTANRNLVANFMLITTQYTITTSANPTIGGTTSGGGTFSLNQSCTVKATALTGYYFVNWTENSNIVSTDTTYTFNVTANRNLIANFAQNATQYTITTSTNPTNGGTASGGGTFTLNQSCTVKATPLTGYIFVDWTENSTIVSTDTTYIFNVTANRNLVANFFLIPGIDSYSLNYSIRLFPNPASEQTTLTYSQLNAEGQLQVYNILGEKVYEQNLIKGTSQLKLIVQNYKAGLYKIILKENGIIKGQVSLVKE